MTGTGRKKEEGKKPEPDPVVSDIRIRRARKRIIEDVDSACREEAEDFLKKFTNDTLTGF